MEALRRGPLEEKDNRATMHPSVAGHLPGSWQLAASSQSGRIWTQKEVEKLRVNDHSGQQTPGLADWTTPALARPLPTNHTQSILKLASEIALRGPGVGNRNWTGGAKLTPSSLDWWLLVPLSSG